MGHQKIQETFRAVSPKQRSAAPQPTISVGLSGSGDGFSSSLSQAAQEIAQLRGVYQTQADLIAANTTALQKNGGGQGASGGSGGVAGAVESVAQHVLGGGLFGLIPLISGIASLFGGGSSVPAPLPTYTPPPSIAIDSTIRNGAAGGVAPVQANTLVGFNPIQASAPNGITTALDGTTAPDGKSPHVEAQSSKLIELLANDWAGNHSGAYPSINEQLMSQASPSATASGSGTSNQSASGNGFNAGVSPGTSNSFSPHVTVNVQAMDSQSFLDRSSDIADAVREAVLNLHPLTSVLADL